MKKKTLIRCDKCGSTNVIDERLEEVEVTILSMDEHIEKNRSKSLLPYSPRAVCAGTSHMEKRILRCRDCDFNRLYECVVYT